MIELNSLSTQNKLNTPKFNISNFSDQLKQILTPLIFAQTWEDPELNIKALELKPNAKIITASNGGCNALAYLANSPEKVFSIDTNPAHTAMLEMKQLAIKHLADYDAVLAYLGDANHNDNLKRFNRHIRPNLSSLGKNYWESRNLIGKPRYHYFRNNAYQYGVLGNLIKFVHYFVHIKGGDMRRMLEAKDIQEQQQIFNQYVAPTLESKLFKFLANHPLFLSSLGLASSQIKNAKTQNKDDLADLFKEKIKRLACNFPIQENCFAQQAFRRQYDTSNQSALPMYLQKRHYQDIKRNIDKLHFENGRIINFLSTCKNESIDAYIFVLSEQNLLSEEREKLIQQITRTAKPDAQILIKSDKTRSLFETTKQLTAKVQWKTDPKLNQFWSSNDKSAVYEQIQIFKKCTE